MRVRWLVVGWVGIGLVVWVGVFALYVENGVQQYLRLLAEFETGRAPEPSLVSVMAQARARGALHAALWAVLVLAAGWVTIAALARRNAPP
jgi:hypothetical protein